MRKDKLLLKCNYSKSENSHIKIIITSNYYLGHLIGYITKIKGVYCCTDYDTYIEIMAELDILLMPIKNIIEDLFENHKNDFML